MLAKEYDRYDVSLATPSEKPQPPNLRILNRKPLSVDRKLLYPSFFLSGFKDVDSESTAFVTSRLNRAFRLRNLAEGGSAAQPLADAVEALSSGYFAQQQKDTASQAESMLAYGKALQSLSEKLMHVRAPGLGALSEQDWDDLHFSCLLLALWEVCSTVSPTTQEPLG